MVYSYYSMSKKKKKGKYVLSFEESTSPIKNIKTSESNASVLIPTIEPSKMEKTPQKHSSSTPRADVTPPRRCGLENNDHP